MKTRVGTVSKHGFTIVELLIVIVVIGILAGLVIVAFNGVQARAQNAKLQSESRTVSNKIQLYNAENSAYPTSILDCPSPSVAAICLSPGAGESYNYQLNPAGGSGYMITKTAGYELTIHGDNYFVYTSPTERTGANEFMQYLDMAPLIDRYGLRKYQLSFDIKSANTTTKSVVRVYFQNGSNARYGGLGTDVNVTTEYTHQTVVFTPVMSNSSVAASMLAFYGTYSTGNIPTVTNMQIQLVP